jgi:hypothetical protein
MRRRIMGTVSGIGFAKATPFVPQSKAHRADAVFQVKRASDGTEGAFPRIGLSA